VCRSGRRGAAGEGNENDANFEFAGSLLRRVKSIMDGPTRLLFAMILAWSLTHGTRAALRIVRGAGTHFMAGSDIKGPQVADRDARAASRGLRAAGGEGAPDDLQIRHRRFLLHPGLPPYRPVGRRRRDLLPPAHRWASAQEAKDNHILNWVVPEGEARRGDGEDGAQASRRADLRARGGQAPDRTSFDNSWDEHSHREAEGLAACAATEDHLEGLDAFLEKRPASFKGR